MPQHRITIDTQAHQYKVLKYLKNNILISNFLCRFQCFVLGVGMKRGVLSSEGASRQGVCVCVCVCMLRYMELY